MLEIKIITPDSTLFEGNAESVTLPGANGSFQVLKGHAPIVSNLVKGEVTVENAGKNEMFPIESGIVEVLNNKVIVLV